MIAEEFLNNYKSSVELTESKNKESYTPSKTYKPSSMKCIRNMYFQMVGAARDINNSTYCSIGITESGSDIHIRVQKDVEDMIKNGFDWEYIDVGKYIVDNNVPDIEVKGKSGMETRLYSTRYNISFMCDGIIRHGDKYYILEIKTENSQKFATRFCVNPEHYNQGTAYSILFNIPEVIFLYVCRDNLDKKAFSFIPTDGMKDKLLNKIKDCNDYIETSTCPPMPENKETLHCKYCDYRTVCKSSN